MPKLLIIGDIHFKHDNAIDSESFINKVYDIVESNNPDYIICLGDILHYHDKLYTNNLNRAHSFFFKLKHMVKKLYILVGNHDMINASQFHSTNHWMNGMKYWDNIEIIDVSKIVLLDDVNVIMCPYLPNDRFIEGLNIVNNDSTDWKDIPLIFAHQEFKGCKFGGTISEHGTEWSDDFPCVISGHIHDKQILGNIYYTGSSFQHSFGEHDEKYIYLLNINGEDIKHNNVNISFLQSNMNKIDLNLSKKITIKSDVTNVNDIVFKKTDDYIRLVLDGNYEEFKVFKKSKKYKEIVNKGIKVVYKPKKLNIISNLNEQTNDKKELSFMSILNDIICKEKNETLSIIFNEIIIEMK